MKARGCYTDSKENNAKGKFVSDNRMQFINKLALRSRDLASERLNLRPLTGADRETLLRLFYNEEIKKTYMIPDFSSEDEAVRLFERMKALSNSDGHFIYLALFGDTAVGFLNDTCVEGNAIELGYVVDPEHKNRGFATEMLKTAIAELFRLGFETVRAGCFEENTASRRVMEKSGMRFTGETESIEYRGKTHRCLMLWIGKDR